MTGRGERSLEEKKRDRGEREAAGDGATGRSVKAFEFGDIGNAWKIIRVRRK